MIKGDKTADQDQKPNEALRRNVLCTGWKLSDKASAVVGSGRRSRDTGGGSVWRVSRLPWLLPSAAL